MQWWLLKTEPEEFSLDDLQRLRVDRWNGVKAPRALKNMAQMSPGDKAFIYHTGKQRSLVGVANVVSAPYPDPNANNDKHIVVDVAYERHLPTPVTLAQVKADPVFAEWELTRLPRLSVMPVPAHLLPSLLAMAGVDS